LLAEWPGANAWYVSEAHGNLQKNDRVCAAIIDLIENDTTRKLSRDWRPTHQAEARTVTDIELRRQLRGKVRADRLSLSERRNILEPTISSEFRELITGKPIAS
jgi:hypothetical protein